MRFLTMDQLLEIHHQMIADTGGSSGISDIGLIESAPAQPSMSFSGQELYPGIAEKGASLAFSLILNHGFIDGNKRVAHAAMEIFLILNGYEIEAAAGEQETLFLTLAAGQVKRKDLVSWVENHLAALP